MLTLSYSFLLLLLLLLASPEVWSYVAAEEKEDVFRSRACPAFLTFVNAAYLSGVTVELPCHCKPTQVQSVVWFFRGHLDRPGDTRALTDHHGIQLLDTNQVPHSDDLRSRFTIRLFSLILFRVRPDDSGIYICGSAHKDFFYGYDLDIQEAQKLSFFPRLSSQRTQDPDSSPPLYRVFTSFQPWSVCDRCGIPGEQVRIGLCYIHSRFLHVRYRRANQTVASCGSGAVPRAFHALKQRRFGATLDVRRCQVVCPSEAPSSSTLLALMAFLGSSQPANVPVHFLNHPEGQILTLGCPRARANMAVAWDRGDEPLYRAEHSKGVNLRETSPRIWIDPGHHLVLQPARTEDSGTYFCWLQGQRAAQIHLFIYPTLEQSQSLMSNPEFPVAVRTVVWCYVAMMIVFILVLLIRDSVRLIRDAAETHLD
ncbi:Ig-like V-type domain-containing protein FAM187A [Pholidichthys leucotaenia]